MCAAPALAAGPRADPTAYHHDGFYLRLSGGLGFGSVEEQSANGAPVTATFAGWGPAYELLLGGTVTDGLVIGGGFTNQTIVDPEIDITGDVSTRKGYTAGSGSFSLLVLGPFVDWFPIGDAGLHAGAMAGLGTVGLDDATADSTGGFMAFAIWGGYDFWIAEQWSLGAEARFVSVTSSRAVAGNDPDQVQSFDQSGTSFALLATVLHH